MLITLKILEYWKAAVFAGEACQGTCKQYLPSVTGASREMARALRKAVLYKDKVLLGEGDDVCNEEKEKEL